MKTYTIKQKEIEHLDTDTSKLEYINQIIALLSDSPKPSSGQIPEALIEGLKSDIPEPMEGAPDFDSSNMAAPEYKRYSLVRAGYVPAGGMGLYCGYSEYEYKHLRELSEIEFSSFWRSAELQIKSTKGKRDYVKFLQYISEICDWFSFQQLLASAKREGIDV